MPAPTERPPLPLSPTIPPRSRVFACLALWLLATVLTLGRPGLPKSLRADEPTHLAMATSLALDGDLRWEAADGQRLYAEYTYAGPLRLHLRSEDGAAYLDRPLLYPLLASPFAVALGARGLYLLNALLWLGILALLWRAGPIFVTTALVLSTGFVYVFWLHPALLLALLVLLALRLGPLVPGGEEPADEREEDRAGRRSAVGARTAHIGIAGAALALAVGQLPWLALLAVPAALAVQRRWRPWLAGLAVGAVLTLALAQLAPSTGDPRTVEIDSPHDPVSMASAGSGANSVSPEGLGEPIRGTFAPVVDLGLALVERRSGLLPHFPFVLPILVLLVLGRRDPASLALGAVLVLLALLQPWIAPEGVGGELYANPFLVVLYPAFLLLLPGRRAGEDGGSGRVGSGRARDGALLAGLVLGALFQGPALISSLGPAMAFGDVQGPTRSPLLSKLPLAIDHVGHGDGYLPVELGPASSLGLGSPGVGAGSGDEPVRLWVPTWAAEPHGDEIWLLGNRRLELYLEVPAPEDDGGRDHADEALIWQVRNLAPGNRIELELGEASQHFQFPADPDDPGHITRWRAEPGPGTRLAPAENRPPRSVRTLRVRTSTGEWPLWRGSARERFYLGTALALFGTPSHLERKVSALEWLGCGVPETVEAGTDFLAAIRLRNLSTETWNNEGAVRVRLGHRWLDAEGRPVAEGPRTDLEAPVAPGKTLESWEPARAPKRPGDYLLELEPVYEQVAWFSERGAPTCRKPVRVTPATRPAAEELAAAEPGAEPGTP